jgi:site-specific recombinase XerD
MNFTEYLQQKKYSVKTVATYGFYIKRFLAWLESENLSPESFTYTDLLEYMRDCQEKGITNRTVNNMLGIIRHYCNYLNLEKKRSDNPAAGVFIKGLVRKLPSGLLNFEELEELYRQYSIQLNVERSKKILFGLMVYQGTSVAELMRITAQDIKLKEGKIKIMGTKRTNERILSLNASQMISIQQYLAENKFKEGALFTELTKTKNSKRNINNRVRYMLLQLKQLNEKVTSAKQIRSSVITHWLRRNNLRQVQYMAGHKYVSSTQRYQVNNLDDLKNELQQHHPMS